METFLAESITMTLTKVSTDGTTMWYASSLTATSSLLEYHSRVIREGATPPPFFKGTKHDFSTQH